MPKAKQLTKDDLQFKSDAQRELMRVILAKFREYLDREQHYYGLMGMSTSHITLKAIEDFTTLRAFWPPELVVAGRYGSGTIYQLEDHTITKVQSSIRKELDKLAEQSYLEKIGNEHERRWRPIKALKGVTL